MKAAAILFALIFYAIGIELTWVLLGVEAAKLMAIAFLIICTIEEKPIPRSPEKHELVKLGVERIIEDQAQSGGGQLGSPSGARRRTYERLKQYAESLMRTLFSPSQELLSAIDDIYQVIYGLSNLALLEAPPTKIL